MILLDFISFSLENIYQTFFHYDYYKQFKLPIRGSNSDLLK